MKLYNIDYIPGQNIEALGLVRGAVVQSKNFGKDFMAGMKTLVGGEIRSYTEMLNEARAIATKRMVDEAENLGAAARVFRQVLLDADESNPDFHVKFTKTLHE